MSNEYVSNSSRILDMVKYCRTPFELNAKPGDSVLITTDTVMDPHVWQSIAMAGTSMGCKVTIMMMPPLPYHQAEPPAMVAEAIKAADIHMMVTSKAFGHAKAVAAGIDKGVKTIYMEEVNVDRLTTGGATLTADEYREMYKLGERIQKIFLSGKVVHVTSETGTDFTAKIYTGPLGRSSHNDSAIIPPPPLKPICAFPAGEVGVSPEPGTGEGVVVYDVSAHYPPVVLKEPIRLTVKKGWVTDIQGGVEAQQFHDYIKALGDKNIYNCPAEISVGLNQKATPTGFMRTDKKMLGGMHIAIGRSGKLFDAKVHLDGVLGKPTFTVDDEVILERGVIKV